MPLYSKSQNYFLISFKISFTMQLLSFKTFLCHNDTAPHRKHLDVDPSEGDFSIVASGNTRELGRLRAWKGTRGLALLRLQECLLNTGPLYLIRKKGISVSIYFTLFYSWLSSYNANIYEIYPSCYAYSMFTCTRSIIFVIEAAGEKDWNEAEALAEVTTGIPEWWPVQQDQVLKQLVAKLTAA